MPVLDIDLTQPPTAAELTEALGDLDLTDIATPDSEPATAGGTPFSCATCTFSVTFCC